MKIGDYYTMPFGVSLSDRISLLILDSPVDSWWNFYQRAAFFNPAHQSTRTSAKLECVQCCSMVFEAVKQRSGGMFNEPSSSDRTSLDFQRLGSETLSLAKNFLKHSLSSSLGFF